MAVHDENVTASTTRRPASARSQRGTGDHSRKAMIGAWLGFFVDLFDIYLPIVALAPAIGYFISPGLGSTGIAVVSGTIFAATLVGRPIGAAIFGWIADTVGRKRATTLAMTGAGVVTLLIALLPGYHQLGIGSVVLFVALRLLAGVFLGGEYSGANPLAMEAAPREKRGLYSGIINTGFPLAYAAVSLITLLLLLVMPSQGSESAYAQWGWRIPFVIGAVLAFVLVRYYKVSVRESAVFRKSTRTKAPIRQLFSGGNIRCFVQVFVLMSGFWLSLQPVAASLPLLLGKDGLGMSSLHTTLVLVAAYLLLAGVDIAAALLSQRIGRRRFLVGASATMAVVATTLYFTLVRFGAANVPWAVITSILLVIIVVSPWAVLPAYINERFPTSVRASGYGLAYSLAVVLPSFYAYYQAGLSRLMPFNYTGIVLLLLGAVLVLAGALSGPETKDITFTQDD
jgi:MFS family permease